jgi:hypothetical protein
MDRRLAPKRALFALISAVLAADQTKTVATDGHFHASAATEAGCRSRDLQLPKEERHFLQTQLMGCNGLIYVDIGTNNGNSVEAWYANDSHADGTGVKDPINPRAFRALPRDPRVFFGAKPPAGADISHTVRQDACAIAFEPNPRYSERLGRMVQKLQGEGKRVALYNATAITTDGGPVTFFTPPTDNVVGSVDPNAWAKSKDRGSWISVNISSIAIAPLLCWLQSRAHHIALKIDVEFLEVPLVDAIINSTAVCSSVRTDLFIEYGFFKQIATKLERAQQTCANTKHQSSHQRNLSHTVPHVPVLRRWARR